MCPPVKRAHWKEKKREKIDIAPRERDLEMKRRRSQEVRKEPLFKRIRLSYGSSVERTCISLSSLSERKQKQNGCTFGSAWDHKNICHNEEKPRERVRE